MANKQLLEKLRRFNNGKLILHYLLLVFTYTSTDNPKKEDTVDEEKLFHEEYCKLKGIDPASKTNKSLHLPKFYSKVFYC